MNMQRSLIGKIDFKFNFKVTVIVGIITSLIFALYDVSIVILRNAELNVVTQFFDLIWPSLIVYVLFGTVVVNLFGNVIYFLLKLGEYQINKQKLIVIQASMTMLLTSLLIFSYILGIELHPTIENSAYIFFFSLLISLGSGTLIYFLIRTYSINKLIVWGTGIIFFIYAFWPLFGTLKTQAMNREAQTIKQSSGKKESPNILWIVIDAARADHFSSYGYERNTTPQIDQIAKEGLLYKNAISPAIWTPSAHASMFTGLFPSEHGVDSDWMWLGDSFTTIAEVMRKNGYYTAGFSNNNYVSQQTNLSKGFSTFFYFPFKKNSGRESLLLSRGIKKIQIALNYPEILTQLYNFINPFSRMYATAENTNEVVKTHIDAITKKKMPFFIFINYMEAHEPYGDTPGAEKYLKEIGLDYSTAKSKDTAIESNANNYIAHTDVITAQDKKIVNALYDGDLEFLDSKIGELVSYLRNKKILDNTVLIITSDHGSNLGEHNLLEHLYDLHAPLTHIPLIIRYPKLFKPGTIEKRIVQTTDIYPTLLDITHVNNFDRKTISGFSLFDTTRPQLAFSEAVFKADFMSFPGTLNSLKDKHTDQRVFGGDWKSIRTADYEYIVQNSSHEYLYNIKSDPSELNNLINSQSQKLKDMKSQLTQFYQKLNHYWTTPFIF